MTKLILILLVALLFEAVGVVYLSKGLREVKGLERVSVREVGRLIKATATNGSFLFGLLLETFFFAGLCYLLSYHDVSLIWPLTALGFVLTALAARYLQQEYVSPTRWLGIGLIVVGVAVVSYSEKLKERRAATAPAGEPPTKRPL